MEHSPCQRLGIVDLELKELVPNGIECFGLGRGAGQVQVVRIDGDIRVQQFVRLSECMASREIGRPQGLSLAYFDTHCPRKHSTDSLHHTVDEAIGTNRTGIAVLHLTTT